MKGCELDRQCITISKDFCPHKGCTLLDNQNAPKSTNGGNETVTIRGWTKQLDEGNIKIFLLGLLETNHITLRFNYFVLERLPLVNFCI